jgi:hypothetical protein
LEAVGKEGIESLKKGIKSSDPEVRFYAAEALAYLDESAATPPLAAAIREQPAFRVFALAALSAMDDVTAYDELRELLNGTSAETRYGAFRSLWAMNAEDPLVKGENFDGRFSYHVLDTQGPPMIHSTRSRRAELVLFGKDQRFTLPLVVEAGHHIMVNGHDGDQVTVSKFAVGEADQKRTVTAKVDDVVRAIVELGGTYPDVVQALQQAKDSHALASRLEVDALPEAGREYRRDDSDDSPIADDEADDDSEQASVTEKADAKPAEQDSEDSAKAKDQNEVAATANADASPDSSDKPVIKVAKKRGPVRRMFAKMTGQDEE